MSQTLRFDYYTIIPHANKPQVLLLSCADGWTLPYFELTERHFWQEVSHVNQAMQEQLDINVTTLRCVCADYNAETERALIVYAMENHSPEWALPPDGCWVGRDALNELSLAMPEHLSLLEGWFAWTEDTAISTLRMPWYRMGWFDSAALWIYQQLEGFSFTAINPIEQLRSWQRSCVLRVNTNAGYVYFKAVPPVFAHEPALTRALAEQYPAHFPKVLGIDTELHWLLMQDMGSQTLDKIPDITRWEEALRTFAQIQIDLAERIDSLIALGCPERQLNKLATQIDVLFADTPAMLPGQSVGLTDTQIEELCALVPQLKAMCNQLASYGVAHTLVHGDLWSKNIVAADKNYIYFDWSDCSVSHPFFDLVFFLMEIEDEFPDIPNVRIRLRDAYLKPWTIYEPVERLIAAFELAQTLAWLHKALIDYQIILHSETAAKHEIKGAIPFYLKMLLHHQASLP